MDQVPNSPLDVPQGLEISSSDFKQGFYSGKPWSRLILIGLLLLLIGWGLYQFWLSPMLNPYSPSLSNSAQNHPAQNITFHQKSLFKIYQSLYFMRMNVSRIRHIQSGQEFLLVSGLDSNSVDGFFREGSNPKTLQSFGNMYLKMKYPSRSAQMSIQKFEVIENQALLIKQQEIPYKRLRVAFRLGDEPKSRHYEGVISRMKEADGRESLMASYGKEGIFDPKYVSLFLSEVSYKP